MKCCCIEYLPFPDLVENRQMESKSLLKIKIISYKNKGLTIKFVNTIKRRYATSLYQIGNVREYSFASVDT